MQDEWMLSAKAKVVELEFKNLNKQKKVIKMNTDKERLDDRSPSTLRLQSYNGAYVS